MIENERLKQLVKTEYSQIANTSCGCCPSGDFVIYDSAEYQAQAGYLNSADMGLSCGCPVPLAGIKQGQTVVDLGCGGGLDAFIAAKQTGPQGKIIGIDFTPAMIEKAEQNRIKLGMDHVMFILSDIENLAVESGTADVVISNCVLNLVPDKTRAFREIHRILKSGGSFCISDMTTDRPWPDSLKNHPALYSSCLSGAIPEKDLMEIIHKSGFSATEILSRKKISKPDEWTGQNLTPEEKNGIPEIYSITVRATKG